MAGQLRELRARLLAVRGRERIADLAMQQRPPGCRQLRIDRFTDEDVGEAKLAGRLLLDQAGSDHLFERPDKRFLGRLDDRIELDEPELVPERRRDRERALRKVGELGCPALDHRPDALGETGLFHGRGNEHLVVRERNSARLQKVAHELQAVERVAARPPVDGRCQPSRGLDTEQGRHELAHRALGQVPQRRSARGAPRGAGRQAAPRAPAASAHLAVRCR